MQRWVIQHDVPTEIEDLTNKEWLHKIRFTLTRGKPHERIGYIFEVTPNGEALVLINEQLGERYFERSSDGQPVTHYPQLLMVPLSLIQDFDPNISSTNRIHGNRSEKNIEEQTEDEILSARERLILPSGDTYQINTEINNL